ncbi:MAG TPA: lysophospholipid acyltransferase family protein [Acidobacteriaceae bacterium]
MAYAVLMAVWAVLGLPVAAITIPWTMATGDVRLLYGLSLAVMRAGLRAAGVRVVVEGREQVPRGRACLYMANHQSNLDPPLLAGVQPGNAAMMVKHSLMRIPVLGFAMRLAHCVPVERTGGLESAKQSLGQAAAVLERGLSITIFPEGTRSADGRLLPFKKGPFFVAMQTGVPVVPVTISGTGVMLAKGSRRLHPGVARVRFHAPLDPASYRTRDALLAAVRAAIASALPAGPDEAAEPEEAVARAR